MQGFVPSLALTPPPRLSFVLGAGPGLPPTAIPLCILSPDWDCVALPTLPQLALHNPHIWANSLKPVCFLCFLLFWCPLLPFIETGTLKIYTKMVLYMKNEIFDLKYPLHGV